MACLLLCTPLIAQTGTPVEATTVATAVPSAVAYDSAGNLYLALRNDHIIRKIDTFGLITTFAGTGEQGFGGDGGPATSALLDSPSGIAFDGAGNLYIADTRNHRIREVVSGTISTVAGTGIPGFSGDSGAAISAQLNSPASVSVDSIGNIYVADTNNQRIRKIIRGVISTVAGTGEQGVTGDGGPATSALIDSPAGVAADPATAGRFFISDTHNQKVRVVDLTGTISVAAGTGVASFGGDAGPAAAAQLNRPQGLAVDSSGNLYVADGDNHRIRTVVGGTISTIAGDGEQGFFGDTGMPFSAVLDSPRGLAISSTGTITFADTHNQRTRSVAASTINTVAGIAPAQTEGLVLSGPISGVYGTAIGSLAAFFSNGSKTATGSVGLLDGGVQITSSPISGNQDSFDLSKLSGGLHSLAVLYGGDANNAAIASGVYLVNIAKAVQTINFPALASPIIYSPGLSVTLAATASSGLAVTYTVTGPAMVSGSTLTFTGGGKVTVTAVQAGDTNYNSASTAQAVQVVQVLIATSVTPASGTVGSVNVPISVAGSGFTSTSVIEINGSPLPTTGTSTLLSAVIPQLSAIGTLGVSVVDTASLQQSATLTFTVTPPTVNATLTGPSVVTSGQQPSVALQLQTAYPVPINGLFTLSFAPSTNIGIDDPAIQFSSGGRTYPFTIAANATTITPVAFQSGTVAGTITITLSLTAGGVDITPASARTFTINIAQSAPSITVTFSQSGTTLTVISTGFSNTREASQATFTFTAAPGSNVSTPTLTLPVTDDFALWFDSAASRVYGSEFSYIQTFNLSKDATIQSVTVTLKNAVGGSPVTPSQ